jgi:hypothetical protein
MPTNGSLSFSAKLAIQPSQFDAAMSKERKAMAHIYTVELRFSGDQLEPTEISARLNLQSSHEFSQIQNQSSTRKKQPYWAYDGKGEIGYQDEWESLEDGFEFLLGNLTTRKSKIIALANQFNGIWWCAHFQSSFDGGPTLSPKLLTELGSYGIPLNIDNYFFSEQDH